MKRLESMRLVAWAVATVAIVFCPQSIQASVTLGDFTVNGKQSVTFAGRTQAELQAIADAAPASTDRLSDLKTDILDYNNIKPTEISIVGYESVSISADGEWNHTPSGGTGPGGNGNPRTTAAAYQLFGISGMAADLNTLVGVFLSDAIPDPNSTPPLLSDLAGDDMSNPDIAQTFAIGESLSDIIVPVGATRLFLGMHDGREWINNSGYVTVTAEAVPEPSTILVWSLLGLFGLIGYKRLR